MVSSFGEDARVYVHSQNARKDVDCWSIERHRRRRDDGADSTSGRRVRAVRDGYSRRVGVFASAD